MTTSRSPATIYEVARRAGVSIATVSRALKGSARVTEGTRSRVLAAAEELQFRPSPLARSLAEGRHAANGIVFPDLSGPYYAEVVLGYEEVAAELGNSVLILATHGRTDPAGTVRDLARRVDGMVIMGRTVPDQVVRQVAQSGVPLVLLARGALEGLDTINAENEASARALVDHLLGHGYDSFAFLGDPAQSPDVAGRYLGFCQALAGAGLTPPKAPVRCAFDVGAGRRAARSVLARSRRPRALVCANDEVALGALRAAEELGLAVPGHVAVTGWDDIMAAAYARLTTVRQPMRELGATAARWLEERVTGGRTAVRRQVLPTRVVLRATCGSHDGET